MAKQLNYIHPNGSEYPESYWRITMLFVDMKKHYARYEFTGYKDQAARLAGKEPIGVRLIEIVGEDFDAGFQEVTLKNKNPQEIGYDYAGKFKNLQKVVTVEPEEEGQEPRAEIIPYSFFEEAKDV